MHTCASKRQCLTLEVILGKDIRMLSPGSSNTIVKKCDPYIHICHFSFHIHHTFNIPNTQPPSPGFVTSVRPSRSHQHVKNTTKISLLQLDRCIKWICSEGQSGSFACGCTLARFGMQMRAAHRQPNCLGGAGTEREHSDRVRGDLRVACAVGISS